MIHAASEKCYRAKALLFCTIVAIEPFVLTFSVPLKAQPREPENLGSGKMSFSVTALSRGRTLEQAVRASVSGRAGGADRLAATLGAWFREWASAGIFCGVSGAGSQVHSC